MENKIIAPSDVILAYEKLTPTNKELIIPIIREIFDKYQIEEKNTLWIHCYSEQWRVDTPKNKISKLIRDRQYADQSSRIAGLNALLKLNVLTSAVNMDILGQSSKSNTWVLKLKINQYKMLELIKHVAPSLFIDPKDIRYIVTIDPSGTIRINGKYLTKPDFDSENSQFFGYVFKNPNRHIKLNEIKEKKPKAIGKDIHKTIQNLKFVGKLREVFFSVNKDTVMFRNPITTNQLKELRIKRLIIPKK